MRTAIQIQHSQPERVDLTPQHVADEHLKPWPVWGVCLGIGIFLVFVSLLEGRFGGVM